MLRESDDDHCCSATLIVTGADLDPDVVSAALGMAPDHSWRRGEHKSFVRNDGTTRFFDSIHDDGGWKCFMPSSQATLPLQDQLSFWLERLSGFGDVIRTFNNLGWETELDCFVATREFLCLTVDALTRLAGLGLGLAVTFLPDQPAATTEAEQPIQSSDLVRPGHNPLGQTRP